MKLCSFKEIVAWQKAQDLAVEVYQAFAFHKDFVFINQIRAAVMFIFNHIAEGYERASNADCYRFLYYATGSASEVKSML